MATSHKPLHPIRMAMDPVLRDRTVAGLEQAIEFSTDMMTGNHIIKVSKRKLAECLVDIHEQLLANKSAAMDIDVGFSSHDDVITFTPHYDVKQVMEFKGYVQQKETDND